jgi:hypothetical protein
VKHMQVTAGVASFTHNPVSGWQLPPVVLQQRWQQQLGDLQTAQARMFPWPSNIDSSMRGWCSRGIARAACLMGSTAPGVLYLCVT